MSNIKGKPDGGAVMSTAEPMEGCSKFYRCSTNVCPLETDWRKRKHIEGESVCSYLLESVKASGADVFDADSLAFLLAKAREIGAAYPAIGRALTKASSGASRILAARGTSAYRGDRAAPMPKVRLEQIPGAGRPQNGLTQCFGGHPRGQGMTHPRARAGVRNLVRIRNSPRARDAIATYPAIWLDTLAGDPASPVLTEIRITFVKPQTLPQALPIENQPSVHSAAVAR